VLAILVERGRADAAQLAPRELGLQHVAGVHRALGLARAHDRMQLVNEQDDLPLARCDFLEKRFEPILELTAILCAGDHCADVHRDEPFILERLRHVAADDAPRQAFGDGRLAHARLADEHRVVLRASREHLHDAADLLVAPDDGVNLPLPGQGSEVPTVFLQSLKLLLGVRIGDALIAAQFSECFEHGVTLQAVRSKELFQRRSRFVEQSE